MLDRETKSTYNLVVTARDCAKDVDKRLSSTVQVRRVFTLSVSISRDNSENSSPCNNSLKDSTNSPKSDVHMLLIQQRPSERHSTKWIVGSILTQAWSDSSWFRVIASPAIRTLLFNPPLDLGLGSPFGMGNRRKANVYSANINSASLNIIEKYLARFFFFHFYCLHQSTLLLMTRLENLIYVS